MANPQIENGYTKIANELLEAICQLNISGNEMRILLYIIRRTYGYNSKSAEVSLAEIAEAVGMRREHISKRLKKLSKMKIIEINVNRGIKPQTISIVKNYDNWINNNVDNCKSLLLPKLATVAKNGNTTVAKIGNHTYKENNKENIKERKKAIDSDHTGYYNRAFVENNNYEDLKKEYGSDVIENYLKKVDRWADKNNKDIGECSDMIRKWLDQDGVKKNDPDIDDYSFVINDFLPL